MMFLDFAAERGLIVRHLSVGRWVRVPTTDKPRSRNGAYFLDQGECFGVVQNWALQDQADIWRPDRAPMSSEDMAAAEARLQASRKVWEREVAEGHSRAIKVAQEMISKAKPDIHPYLASKGFSDLKGLVLEDALLIRMEDCRTGELLGLQTIAPADGGWEKKMLRGMRAKGAVHRLGSPHSDQTWLVEGFATGLSVESAIRSLCASGSVVVCFSAGNIVTVAERTRGDRMVFADNDVSGTGQQAAVKSGLPWCMSDETGEDANDLMQRAGLFAVRDKLIEPRKGQ